ncbi:MAG: adenylate/guanylate cyclase domain-containing protein [Gammaproteobacteria bacterium]|nr:adenylate/guanylate cyclase domain-containing protein [Gammaproteobacteria bacterium]
MNWIKPSRFLPSRSQSLTALAWLVLAWSVALGLYHLPAWELVEHKLFDLASLVNPPGQSQLPITIVSIDEASFAQIGQQWPWPRSLHAQLLNKLHAKGAAVIAFDILFTEASSEEEDLALSQAIENTLGAVVLAADTGYHETASVRQWLRVDPLPRFTQAGAATGLASVSLDDDGVVRRFPQQDDAFWRQIIRTLIAMQPGLVEEPGIPANALIRYLGPPHTFPFVSYYQVVNEDPSIPEGFFQDQIVIIGRDLKSTLDDGSAQADMFATPFVLDGGRLTSGVEIHANLVENALMGMAIKPAPVSHALLALAISALIALPAVLWWHFLRSGLLILLSLGGLTGISLWLLESQSLWLPFSHLLLAYLLLYFGMGVSSYLAERRRALGIKSAFAMYVSGDVVNQMIGSQDALRLGGERKEMSILFSDLAGFTSISEKLSPEEVANLMNRYLTRMTRVIHHYRGTVDKFIGDAVMAFWNAPLDDDQHALHAVQAALGMQQALAELRAEMGDTATGPLAMRIGVHTGPAVVGNMGSEERFNYTVLGDTVNLASRLEGVNKYYGTWILLSENTAEVVAEQIRLRPVDLVKVKGKAQAVKIFTPCEEESLARASSRALDFYLAGNWAEARSLWESIQRLIPEDSLARLFLARLDKLEANPPEHWDGATSLEK